MTVPESLQTAVAHHQAGRLREAEGLYRQILTQQPNHPDALHLLGVIASQMRQYPAAVELINRAISANPGQAEYHGNLGVALGEMGKIDEAMAAYRRAIVLKPDGAQFHNNLGNALTMAAQNEAAMDYFRRAIQLNGEYAEPHYNLGNIYRNAGQFDEAIGRYRRALSLRPGWSEAINNLGNALCAAGRFDEAGTIYRQTLALRPDDPLARWNLSLLLLRQGNLRDGLPEYEWRWQVKELGLKRPDFSCPQWDGSPLNGRRIFLYCEQGFGDTIQFIRYLPMVAGMGGSIIAGVQPELLPLLQSWHGPWKWTSTVPPAGDFDLHCPLVSLPAVMKTTEPTIPGRDPYIMAPPENAAQWRQRLPDDGRKKIGLAWAGRSTHPHDRQRSIAFEQLAPLAGAERAAFFSLQKGLTVRPSQPEGLQLIDWTTELHDFSDTAALIANLDLVITVDTSVAHLAAAMGKPVWVMLPFVPDWRWMLERGDSPWYPTIKLFRQRRYGDWAPVINQVAAEVWR
jgi:tetratricopeptide (TPR) repeat protein